MNRQIPTNANALTAMLRNILDQLAALNRGAAFSGRVSFGGEIQVGEIVITTTANTVVFTNPATGLTATITLT